MHYKNGREAKTGDSVITKNYSGNLTAGVIYDLVPGGTCNCSVAVLVPGGTQQLTCQNVGNMYHVEDAFAAIEPKIMPGEAAQQVEAPKPQTS